MASVIEAYLAEVERYLACDPRLARRIRAELADHLAETMQRDAQGLPDREPPHPGAEARAVARLGPAGAIAAPLLMDRASRQAERTWLVMLAAFLATFAAMRLRSLWLAPDSSEAAGSLALAVAPLVDRWAFVLALAAGVGGYVVAVWARAGDASLAMAGLARAGRVLNAVAAALVLSILAGFARIGLAADLSPAPLLVFLATCGEVALVVLFAIHVRRLASATARAGAAQSG